MNRSLLRAIALGIGGLVVAMVLTLGAFAIAGQDISQPAGVPMFTAPSASPSPGHDGDDHRSPDPKASKSPSSGDDHGGGVQPSPGGGADDHGGGSGSGGSDDGSSVSSGSGSGGDPGSDASGSGSGSGSDSGSDDSGGHGDD
jgi:hypothetical protein